VPTGRDERWTPVTECHSFVGLAPRTRAPGVTLLGFGARFPGRTTRAACRRPSARSFVPTWLAQPRKESGSTRGRSTVTWAEVDRVDDIADPVTSTACQPERGHLDVGFVPLSGLRATGYAAGYFRGAVSIPIQDLKSHLRDIPHGAEVFATVADRTASTQTRPSGARRCPHLRGGALLRCRLEIAGNEAAARAVLAVAACSARHQQAVIDEPAKPSAAGRNDDLPLPSLVRGDMDVGGPFR
jgi:hypothetical protein